MQNVQAAGVSVVEAGEGSPRICFVAPEFPLLSETFIIDQVLEQQARGFDVSVVADRVWPVEKALNAGSDLVRIVGSKTAGRWPEFVRASLARLPGRVRRRLIAPLDALYDRQFDDFDAMVAHFGTVGQRLARSREMGRFKRPFATIFHGRDVAIPLREGALQQYRALFRQGDLFLPVSDYFGNILIEAGADPAKVRTHRTGVNCESIPYTVRRDRTGALQITSAARLVEKKGLEFALRALAYLASYRPDLVVHYEVIGDGPLGERLKALTGELGIGDRVTFAGPQPHEDVKARLAISDLFLLPSVTAADGDSEGVPVALMEAMAAGLPVVSSAHSGIPELIETGRTGLLADERDISGLARHIEWIADNPDGSRAMAEAARAFVEAEFNQRILNDRLAAMLAKLARQRNDG